MEQRDFDILASTEGEALVARHLTDDPERVALKLRNPAVTQQIRMLQRCRTKLPGYYAARCIVPQVAYEQASSEATASARTESILSGIPLGERRLAVDLTCGLGVDAWALGRSFERVVAVEVDPLRAQIARWNFDRLGAGNIEVVADRAEHFVAEWPEDRTIDLLYIDPSRKTADGKRVYSLEDSSPNILELLPDLRQMARRIVVKLSPLFDVAEVYRRFGPEACVEVISLDGECKEVLAKIGFSNTDAGEPTPAMRVTVIRRGEVRRFDFDREIPTLHTTVPHPTDVSTRDEARFLLAPDVAFYKTRTVEAYRTQYLAPQMPNDLWLDGGYLFADELPAEFTGKTYRITFRHPYQPKVLARMLRSRGIRRVNVHRRNFPYSSEQIARDLGVDLGGTTDIFCIATQNGLSLLFVLRID
ncbi:MAG: class I SAM-dependent methyltransferase [Rikenella sp.]|nr:class I SAM-dependent methyltransferase [Rikenella sp.]